ncbi:hypothetical protein QI116_12030 [Staphylococcus saprophyticus]|nr:hypothetical protein [Staphylococcus saprophyticus]MDW3991180.1 hypothetical protein [Staphylococcus saprophyticus]MDW4389781.1 hypothetical protein [Staphylococcus saprophyticus]
MIAEGGVFALSSIYVNYNTFSYHQISRMILKKKRLKMNKLLIFYTKTAPYKFKKRKIQHKKFAVSFITFEILSINE